MLKIIGKNKSIQDIVDLFSPDFTKSLADYVNNHRAIKRARFPLSQNVKKFIVWYMFFEDKNLIIIEAFKTKNSPEINFAISKKEEFEIRAIHNKFLDYELFVE